MRKKSFKGGMDGLLGGNPKDSFKAPLNEESAKRGRPKTNFKEISKTSQLGTKDKETRATFIVNEEQLEKIKAMAYWERTSIKDILANAIEGYLSSKKGEVSKAINSYKSKDLNK